MISMRIGSAGPDVKLLQQNLKELGYNISADGTFGLSTRTAVKNYQGKHRLNQDGIAGIATCRQLDIVDEINAIQAEMEVHTGCEKPVDYKQYDSRWKNIMYSNHGDKKQTIGSSGCGPTSASDIVATKTDEDFNPEDAAELSLGWGCRTYSDGTSISFFKKIAAKYNYTAVYSASIEEVKQCLIDGGIVVVNFGTGTSNKPWYQLRTKGGHYSVIYDWDGFKFYVNDTASAANNRKTILPYELKDCGKRYVLFYFN